MVNSVGTSAGATGAYSVQLSVQALSISAATGASDPDADGDVHGVGGGSDSASVSGPGKLLSQLQQLETQDPAKFKQVMAEISTKLQTAAKQATGGPGQFLSGLASQFQAAATSGDLSGLMPQHGHHHHGTGTYNRAGQVTPPSAGTSVGSTGGADLRQLFAGISQEVAQALGG